MGLDRFERILVTGGSGFIGRALLDALVAMGKRPMVADVMVDESRTNGAYSIARIDLTDETAFRALVADFQPELAIHLAGATIRQDDSGERSDLVNFQPVKFLLESLFEAGGQKAVLMGSAAEYGGSPTPFLEHMQPRPISPYARSKARATRFALEYGRQTSSDVTVLRTFTAYGPGQPANMFLSQLVRHAVMNERFNMSEGTQRRDLVYIDDVVRALMAASVSDRAQNKVINIANGRSMALRSIAEYAWKQCGADPEKLAFGTMPSTGDDAVDTWADISLAAELLGWKPTVSFETGMASMIAAAKEELGK